MSFSNIILHVGSSDILGLTKATWVRISASFSAERNE